MKKIREITEHVIRIEIWPPERIEDIEGKKRPVIIKKPQTIQRILSTLKLTESDRNEIASCKVPPGFRVVFFLPDEVMEADVTIDDHKHIILWKGKSGEKIHYDLPPAFEKIIRQYLKKSLKRWSMRIRSLLMR